MNKYGEMRKASEDLKVAWNHFNYAPTVYHTDLAIQEIKVAEDKISYLRKRAELDIEEPAPQKKSFFQKTLGRLRRKEVTA